MENIKSSSKISFGCMAWPGVLLSIAIIAIRAFQANAQPIESWSVFSWFLMMEHWLLKSHPKLTGNLEQSENERKGDKVWTQ